MAEVKSGIINPYALAEIVAGRSIQWDSIKEPKKKLEEILNLKAEDIFDIRKPILNPKVQIEANGSIRELSEAEAKTRLSKTLAGRPPRQIKPAIKGFSILSKLQVPQNADAKLQETLLNMTLNIKRDKDWDPPKMEWADKGDYFEDLSEYDDPIQGALANCYFIAALSAVAWSRPYAIVNAVRPYKQDDEEFPVHRVAFYKDGSVSQAVEVTEAVPVEEGSRAWVYARSFDRDEIWPAVMEKAYAKWRTGTSSDRPDYNAIAGGDTVMACAELIRGERAYYDHPNFYSPLMQSLLFSTIKANTLGGRTVNPVVTWTYAKPPANLDYFGADVAAWHAYTILGVDNYKGENYIVLRNPWGNHHAVLDTRPGLWTVGQTTSFPGMQIPLDHKGVFSMRFDTYLRYFAGTGIVK